MINIYLFNYIVGNKDYVNELTGHHKIICAVHISDELDGPKNPDIQSYAGFCETCKKRMAGHPQWQGTQKSVSPHKTGLCWRCRR